MHFQRTQVDVRHIFACCSDGSLSPVACSQAWWHSPCSIRSPSIQRRRAAPCDETRFTTDSCSQSAVREHRACDDAAAGCGSGGGGRIRARAFAGKQAESLRDCWQLDPRLRLNACDAPLETFSQNAASTGARVTVGVRCTAADVDALCARLCRGRGARARPAPCARSSRAHAPTDVEPQMRRSLVRQRSSSATSRICRGIDSSARCQSAALTVDMLTPDLLVRRGQQVTVIAASGPVEIRAQGLALTDGAATERVRVQNVTSLKVVEGVVESESVVRVGL